MSLLLTNVIKRIESIINEIQVTKNITSTCLIYLSSIIGFDILVQALHLVDLCVITLIESPNKRFIYRVVDKYEQYYVGVESAHYCQCLTFLNSFEDENLHLCQHILSVKLAKALEKITFEMIQDETLSTILFKKL